MTRWLWCLLVFFVPTTVQAQDTLFRASLVAAVAAHGADLATTEYCLGAGKCREANPFLLRFDQPAVFGAVKMGVAAVGLWGTAKLNDAGHKRWAVLVNLAQAGAFTAVAVHNARATR